MKYSDELSRENMIASRVKITLSSLVKISWLPWAHNKIAPFYVRTTKILKWFGISLVFMQ